MRAVEGLAIIVLVISMFRLIIALNTEKLTRRCLEELTQLKFAFDKKEREERYGNKSY